MAEIAARMETSLSTLICFSFTWVHILTFQRPNCFQCDQHRFCNCSSQNFLQLPAVPENVITLDVSFNQIESVEKKDLSLYTQLEILNMQKNRLKMIHEDAFRSQHNLVALDLSSNNLERIASSWFRELKSLKHLDLLGNLYTTLGSSSLFRYLGSLRTLKFGNLLLKKVKKNVLRGLPQLDEMIFVGRNLSSYEPGSFKMPRPIITVSLSFDGLFQENSSLVSNILRDVSHPETSLTVRDAVLSTNESMQPFKEVRQGGTKRLTLQNVSTTDEAVTTFLKVMDGSPLAYIGLEDVQLEGKGWWEKAWETHYESLHTVFIRNVEIQGFFQFSSMVQLAFLLKYPSAVSVINCTVFVMPCGTSALLKNIEYLDLSQNLLTDVTIRETLCNGEGKMHHLSALNVSYNSLKTLDLIPHMVTRLTNLTFLDISHNDFLTMPQKCAWPASLRFLNLSATKLRRATPCLPVSLTVLDLSQNDLTVFRLNLPNLVELRISGNRLVHFPEGGTLPSLSTLLIKKNTFNMFNKTDLMSFANLHYLEAGLNNFVCSCEFVAFFDDEVDHLVMLRDGRDNYVCDSPFVLRGHSVASAQLSVFECHMIPAVSILCSTIVLVLVLVGVTCRKLHVLWYLQMTAAWIRAKQKPAVHRARENLRYDAFVSYSQRDAEWVEEILVPKLESSQPPFALCLHRRDFRPGRWIVDNIIESIERSHRTLFVLSEHFVTSEWCRYELDFSHFRIVDEHDDSAVLVLLEPIAKETIPKRFCKLRKLMNSRTYLEWPQEEERREEFWCNLQAALKMEDS
ncbi:toll-like receptor 2 [Salminus brasiliensis]|uniref:toll-like receptor 2 n=1 Tax=Salminus brasiliensis TaxID=930266 RepID=UPI003B831F3E